MFAIAEGVLAPLVKKRMRMSDKVLWSLTCVGFFLYLKRNPWLGKAFYSAYLRLKGFVVSPKINYEKAKSCMVGTFEALRPNSTETKLTPAKCSVLIGKKEAGDFVPHGCGVRFQNWLVLPDHVYSGGDLDGKPIYAMGRQVSGGVDISYKEVKTLDTDLVYIELSNQDWATIGASTATIVGDIPPAGLYAQIVGCLGKGTAGRLSHDPSCFGRIVYDSTTMPGYSGAPYMANGRIAGVHQSGSAQVNGGYSANYIWITLNHLENRKFESSEDWLLGQYQEGGDIEIDTAWGGLDDVRVRVGGRYAIVDISSMNKAFGGDWRGKSRLRARKIQSYELESLNERSRNSGDSGKVEESPVQEKSQESQLMEKLMTLSDDLQRKVLHTLSTSRQKRNTPKGLLTQKKGVSESILDS